MIASRPAGRSSSAHPARARPLALATALLLALVLVAPVHAGSPPAGAVQAQLVKVIDGGAIDVLINDKVERVRYVGVDTPERSQPGFSAATEANRNLLQAGLLGAGPLYLVEDVSERDQTSSHRLLRYVYTADGTLVEQALVAGGWAQPVEYPPDVKFAKPFRQLAVQAAQKRVGFWAAAPPPDGAMPYGLTTGPAKVRKGPATSFAVNATLTKDTPLTIYGRTAKGDWLQVRTPTRAGGWIAASLVRLNVPLAQVPVSKEIPTASAPANKAPAVAPLAPKATAAASSELGGIALVVVKNDGKEELLELRNGGGAAVDVGGWTLYGSKGDDRCTLPAGTVLGPGEAFQVATGTSQPAGRGTKCGDKPIWNNGGETIYLQATGGGGRLEIQAERVR